MVEPSAVAPLRAGIYARLSKKERRMEDAEHKKILVNQVNFLKDYAKLRQWAVADIYIDEDYTGANQNRPDFQRMSEDVRFRKFDVVLVYKVDRLGRNTEEGLAYHRFLKDHKVDLHSATEPFDTTTAVGRLMFRTYLNYAEYERDIISERTTHALKQKKEAGVKLGRPRKDASGDD